MQDLIILGTGVHAAEMAQIVARINAVTPTWDLIGHIAPGQTVETAEFYGTPVLGTRDTVEDYPRAMFVPDNEFPKNLPVAPERLASLIDPSCFVHQTAEIGRGCVLYPGCFVGVRARLGDQVFCLANAIINHDDTIGARCVFAAGAILAGVVTVETDCYLGQGCMIRQSLRIGKGSRIGMGAVVVKDVGPGSVMVGNPARPLRRNESGPSA